MLVEQLIFTVISFALFVLMFFKMIKNNDTTYVIFLVLQAIGIALNFLEVLFTIHLNIVLKVLMYIFAIIIPIILLVLDKLHFGVAEMLNIFKANLAFTMGNNKKAKQILINLIEKQGNSYKAHKLLAQIYEKEGGMRKAIDEYVQAIDIDKKDYASYFKVADLLNGLDKKDEATQMLTSLLTKKPDYKEASMLLGDLLIEQEMYKEALNVYHEALKYNPLDFDINYNLGIAYTMVNDFQSAKEYYEKAANINTIMHACKYSLAEIALIYKELEEAERMFMESIDDEELAPDGYYELSKICLIKGDKERAIQYANIAIDLNPNKIAQKVKKDPIFIPILAKISIPFNLEETEEQIKGKMTKKEIMAKEHLEEMSEITRQIGYNDIQMFTKRTKGGTTKEVEENQNNIERGIL